MTTAIFDTLAYYKKLKVMDVPEAQAEIQAEAIAELIEDKLATKNDLKELKKDILISISGMLVAAISILAVLIKIL